MRPVVRLGPRLDGVLLDRLRLVGHRQVQVELDDVAEAVTGRAGPEGAVEREQPRLGHLVGNAALPALEPLAEPVHDRGVWRAVAHLYRERRAAAFQVGRLHRVGHPSQQIRSHLQAVHDNLQTGAVRQRAGIDIRKADRPALDDETTEPVLPQRRDGGLDRGLRPGRGPGGRARSCGQLGVRLIGDGLVPVGPRDDRKLESEQQPGACRQRQQLPRRRLGRLADDLVPALPADGAPGPREEQPQVVVDLGGRADRRPRVPQAVLLPDRDGGTDPVDLVGVGLPHPLEELPGVGRERFDIPPLPFGVDGVERQRRLPGAADSGDDDQLPGGQRQVDVLEVVGAGAPDDDAPVLAGWGCWHARIPAAP